MNKKTAIITIILVLLLLGAGALWFYFSEIRPGTRGPDSGSSGDVIFPIDGGGGANQGGQGGNTGTSTGPIGVFRPRFIQLTTVPVGGGVVLEEEGKNPVARYVERGTGRLHDIDLVTLQTTRLTNTTIPKVYEALLTPDGTEAILRYLNDNGEGITTFHAEVIPGENGAEGSLQGTFLQNNIRSLAAGPNSRIFYLVNTNQGATGILSDLDGSRKTQVWSSPLKEWQIAWPGASTIAITSKPSFDTPGTLFFLNPVNGRVTKVLGDVIGLTSLVNPDGKYVFYSGNSDTGLGSALYDVERRTVIEVNFATMAEKCAWDKQNVTDLYCAAPSTPPLGQYPDSWYQGKVSFTDAVWKVDGKTGYAEYIIASGGSTGKELDIIDPKLSSTGKYLLFINKKDLTLWALQLKE